MIAKSLQLIKIAKSQISVTKILLKSLFIIYVVDVVSQAILIRITANVTAEAFSQAILIHITLTLAQSESVNVVIPFGQ
jgi:hypothetical protein